VEREDLRSEARERALTLLYEAEAKGLSPAEVLEALPVTPDGLAVAIVQAVGAHAEQIDGLITSNTRGWTLERMAMTDRNVLRLATAELLTQDDTPTAVVLNEAVDLAKRFGTDDSGRFVNGVLAAIARQVRPAT
jgi:transcription antitermination protein NusB